MVSPHDVGRAGCPAAVVGGEGDVSARYLAAAEVADVDGLLATLAPDGELVSPISGRMVFRGERDLRPLLAAVYTSLTKLRWTAVIRDGRTVVAIGEARIGPLRLGDAMVFELAEDGRIQRVRPHLRPWLGTTVFAVRLAAKMTRHPGALLRALRA